MCPWFDSEWHHKKTGFEAGFFVTSSLFYLDLRSYLSYLHQRSNYLFLFLFISLLTQRFYYFSLDGKVPKDQGCIRFCCFLRFPSLNHPNSPESSGSNKGDFLRSRNLENLPKSYEAGPLSLNAYYSPSPEGTYIRSPG